MELSHILLAVPNPSKYVKKYLLKLTNLSRVRALPLGTNFVGTKFSLLISIMRIFRYIYQYIYMEVREEKEWENVTNNRPPMTVLQAKLLALLGQAHDMFSRIFHVRIYEISPLNIM